jgi:4-diphosphocytidyl-2-C-methyl-D-erythritol kinase
MLAKRHADAVVVQAPAKINLFLEVLGKRPDGYHEVVTCMVAVDLCDTLLFQNPKRQSPKRQRGLSSDIELVCDDPAAPAGPQNLIWRAAELLRKHTGEQRGVRIQLTKRIPVAAGLAGGSSDAAATLIGLNELWRLNMARSELAELSAKLGSDIPFFFATPAAWCTGRGERVEPFRLERPLHLVLANPGVELSTAAVYRQVTVPAEPRSPEGMRQALDSGSIEAIAAALFNRLQAPAEQLCPEGAALQRILERLRPVGHLMSGSGPSYFALCRSRAEARRLAANVRSQSPSAKVFVVRTLTEKVLSSES